jgi:CPA2 family monovalent cation:H+ antiporter-2
MKQPVVLGYLIAGVLVGPHVPFIPTVHDSESVKVWAEIGVIFLLFGLGLEFSFKKLARVGKSATISALFEIVTMIGIGFVTGMALGWSKMDSIFLGGVLAVSSTTIIVRAFDELGMKGRRFVSLVFGVLIVEDLVAILLLVLLSTIAVTQTLSGTELIGSTVRLGFFLLLWFLVGIYVLPIFLARVRKYMTDETTLVVSIGLCLLMVMIGTNLGFSPALGAFVMGSLIAETRDAKRVEHLINPVRDLFAAVFFVSVGMMIDPAVLVKYWPQITLLTVITIVGKLFGSGLGALVSGRSLKDSVQAGLSLAQIGEFSFIIATLGVSLKVTSDFLYPIVVAVSAVTTFTTPYMIKFSEPTYHWISRHMPAPLLSLLERYEAAANQEGRGSGFAGLIWDAYGLRILFNSILTIAVGLSLDRLARPILVQQFGEIAWFTTLFTVIGLIVAAPFIWAVVFGGGHSSSISERDAERLNRLGPGILLGRILLGFSLIVFLIHLFEPMSTFIGASATLAMVALIMFASRYAAPTYKKIENRFFENLTDKERAEQEQNPVRPALAPWDASLAEMVVSPDSEVVGKTLLDAKIKERFGVMVSLIERGSQRILAPSRDQLLMPYDRIFVIGNDEELNEARRVLEEAPTVDSDDSLDPSYGLSCMMIKPGSRYIGRALRDSGLREDADGIVVGIEREGVRILNPDSGLTIQEGDMVWLVGDMKRVDHLRTAHLKTEPTHA